MTIEQHDHRKIRCRMLGHEITFAYCREPGAELPCRKIFDCWFERFDIENFIRRHYPQDQIEKILTPTQPKITSLVDLIEQAQKRARENPPENNG